MKVNLKMLRGSFMVLQGCFKVASRILKGYLADNSWIFKDTLVIVETMFLFFYLNDNLLLEKPPKDNTR